MSFLAPWFLAGVVLIAGPIVAHLIRRATRERLHFSTLRFLDVSAPRLDRRSRVQNPWLLALRCLIVAVLAFGFARPFLQEQAPLASAHTFPRDVVAVLDESASMQRAGLWDAACERIAALAAGLGPADHFVLLSAGDRVTELISADRWRGTAPEDRRALVRAVLGSRRPGWGPTPLDGAAEAALARWEDMTEAAASPAQRELVIVSDFGSGSRVTGLANVAWPSNAKVSLETVTPTVRGNASLHWLGWSRQDPARPAARVRVARSFDAPESLRLQWRDARSGDPLGGPESLALLPGASDVRLVPLPANAPLAVSLELGGDEQDFDNRLWIVRSAPRQIDVTYLAPPADNDPQHAHFYVSRATAGWREPVARLSAELPEDPNAAALLIVPAPLDATRVADVRARIESGAFALVLLDRDELVATAAALAAEPGWRALAPARSDALLGQLDFQHPLFSAFADPLYSDFTGIRFWEPRSVTLPATTRAVVVARFDDNSPAVFEVPVGRGRLVVWGGGWTPRASQWVLSSKFVPWLQALAERAAGGTAQAAMAELGNASSLLAPGSTAQWRLVSSNRAEQDSVELPSEPGVYQVTQSDDQREVALLVPAAESQIDTLPLETWEQLGVPLRSEASSTDALANSSRAAANAATLENRQQMWRWLLWLAVALLAFESLASFAVSRRRVTGTA